MLGLDFFTEIMVVGFLFSLAIVPAFKWRTLDSLVPADYGWIKQYKPALAAIAVVLIYVAGVAGNRITSRAFELIPGDPEESFDKCYRKWAGGRTDTPARLKLAEFKVRERSEVLAQWSERNRFTVRILRGLTTASLIFMLVVTYRRFMGDSTYSWRAIAAALFITLSSYWISFREAWTYWRLITQLSGMPADCV
ncbi:MAG TPA: hypothetical protein VN494_11925 [Patescibacteria group bacterium]|nr:hypothetical protein [Patescibacteria group bacterium]